MTYYAYIRYTKNVQQMNKQLFEGVEIGEGQTFFSEVIWSLLLKKFSLAQGLCHIIHTKAHLVNATQAQR